MSAQRITIKEATRLTGRSRRSLYRDMAAGHLSYHPGNNGRRLVDVSELIRAYGALVGEPERTEPEATPPAASNRTDDLLAELLEVTRQQAEEIAALRRDVTALRRLPAPAEPTPPLATQEPQASTEPEPQATPPKASNPPRDFSDLLARFEARTKH